MASNKLKIKHKLKYKLKHIFTGLSVVVLLALLSFSCTRTTKVGPAEVSETYVQDHYTKQEVDIPMRDGITLHTTIYAPKDTSKKYPIIMQRTPYSSAPYGQGKYKEKIAPNIHMMQDGYIVVYQDVRGRWLSEGHYENMRAYVPNKKTDQDVDESSDTYDTIDWLVNNVENNNGKVGIWGISYPGFYCYLCHCRCPPCPEGGLPTGQYRRFLF
jgi:uncharacterized protein